MKIIDIKQSIGNKRIVYPMNVFSFLLIVLFIFLCFSNPIVDIDIEPLIPQNDVCVMNIPEINIQSFNEFN